jgi:deoxyuridine 5'-triphosphate nucleotidohydrolase
VDIHIKLLSDLAKTPTQGTQFSAGYDLYAAEEIVVPRLGRKLIKTNVSMAIPMNHYGRIAPRSGLAYKNGIDVLAGVIDSDYRGDIGVILYNTDNNLDFSVKTGDKIAQIIIESCSTINFVKTENLPATKRGEGGYGHTG